MAAIAPPSGNVLLRCGLSNKKARNGYEYDVRNKYAAVLFDSGCLILNVEACLD